MTVELPLLLSHIQHVVHWITIALDLQKRNKIVWYVAQQLSDKRHQSIVGKVAWRYDDSNFRRPILVLQPPVGSSGGGAANAKKSKKRKKSQQQQQTTSSSKASFSKARIRVVLHFGMDSADWIPPLRLVPNRCNLGNQQQSTLASSHAYNEALIQDVPTTDGSNDKNADTLHAIVQEDPYLYWHDSLILLQIWCLQRGLLRRHDGWTTEVLAWSLVYLYRTKRASPRMAPLQVLQAWWKWMTDANWLGDKLREMASNSSSSTSNNIRKAPSEAYVDIRDGPRQRAVLVMPLRDGASQSETVASSVLAQLYAQQTMESPLTPNDPPTLVDLYARQYSLGPVLLDSSMRHNLLGRLTPATIRQTQRDARLSLERLHNHHRPFASLFMKDARFWSRYDAYLRIPYSDFEFGKSNLWGQDRLDVGDAESIRRGVQHVLGTALNNRVREIQILSTGNGAVSQQHVYDAARWHDADQIPTHPVVPGKKATKEHNAQKLVSPTGDDSLILGIAIDPDICFRVVDRGPPADDAASTEAFLELWGNKAELRRFKDGAIVHATVWNDEFVSEGDYYHYSNDDKWQGGIVEQILRHVLGLHFLKEDAASNMQFSLRNMLSCVDSVYPGSDEEVTFNPVVAHRLVMKAFDSLSNFLRESSRPTIPIPGSSERKSRLGMPLAIDAVEPLAPSLRYADLFPPVPHPLLGGMALPGMQRVSQAVQSQPIFVQIRFGSSSKWPTDLKAIKAAKAAMLIQMLEGIDTLKKAKDPIASKFGDHPVVCADFVDIAFRGYVFRIMVRADPELRLLQNLFRPTEEATALLQVLTRRHVTASTHHSIVHAVYTRHASASVVVRLAHRWIASHLLSNHFAFETIELLVAYVYACPSSPTEAPATVTAGFLRFLDLLATHDWKREPLIVDPQNSFSMDMYSAIVKDFEATRGPNGDQGTPLFVVSPSDQADLEEDQGKEGDKAAGRLPQGRKERTTWIPSFSTQHPEWVVLNRAVMLAAKSHRILQQQLEQFNDTPEWSVVFSEPATSFEKYSVLMRVDPDFAVDSEASSSGGKSLAVMTSKAGAVQSSYTRSMIQRYKGPKPMQRKLFKNLLQQEDILLEWHPVDGMMSRLEGEIGHLGLLFYNHLCPEVVGLLWRPGIFTPKPFSAIQSEWARPVVNVNWKSDTLVTVNTSDVFQQASKYTRDIVIDQKILDGGMKIESGTLPPRKRPAAEKSSSDDDDDAAAAEAISNNSDDDSSESSEEDD